MYNPTSINVVDITDDFEYNTDGRFTVLYKLNSDTKLLEEVAETSGMVLTNWKYHDSKDIMYVTGYKNNGKDKLYTIFQIYGDGSIVANPLQAGFEVRDYVISSDGNMYFELYNFQSIIPNNWWYLDLEGQFIKWQQ